MKSVFDKPGVKQIAFMVMLVVYSLFGAYMMMALEEPSDNKIKQKNYEKEMKEFDLVLSYKVKLDVMSQNLDRDKTAIIKWCSAKASMTEPQLEDTSWNSWEALFYVTSLYTTIGYGNIHPVTVTGRCFTMLYAIIGIPLVILILDDWGKQLFRLVTFLWTKLTKIKRCRQKVETGRLLEGDNVNEMKNVPLLFALFICIGYICFCAAIYLIWEEEWNYFVSFYFFFISLTTVGLGDVLPKHIEYSVCASVLVLLGLAVVSMCLNVIQAKLDGIFTDLAKAIDRKYKERLLKMDENSKVLDGKKGMKSLENEQNWQERLLLKMMNGQKKQLLEEKMEQKSKLRNTGVQAAVETNEIALQTINETEETGSQATKKTSEMGVQAKGGRRFEASSDVYRWNLADDN